MTRRLDLAPAIAFGVASFYAMFSTTPRPPVVAYVCDDVPCRLAGAVERIAALRSALGPPGTPRDEVVWEPSPCLGLCDFAPAALVDGRAVGVADPDAVKESLVRAVAARRAQGGPTLAGPPPRPHVAASGPAPLLRRVLAGMDALDLDAYVAHGGLVALREALRIGPAGVLAALKSSRLAGRGGAAFPAATKWEAVAQHPVQPHYVVVNADESETGTFKDRILLEWDPYAVLEGAAIAAYTCGAERVFIYIRGEYRHAYERFAHAIREAVRSGWLGNRVLGSDARVTVELRRGAGAYICGEETALLNSLEGKRGEPPLQAALSGPRGLVRPAHGDRQRRDAGLRARDPGGGRRRLPRARHPGLAGHEALRALRPRRPARRIRGSRSARRSARWSTWAGASARVIPSRHPVRGRGGHQSSRRRTWISR